MQHAHQEYGHEFERAYTQLTSMDTRSPLARELVQHVMRSDDPGETLMSYVDSDVIRSLSTGRGTPPPFLPRNTHRPLSYSDVAETNFNSGYGDEATEDAIFKAAIG